MSDTHNISYEKLVSLAREVSSLRTLKEQRDAATDCFEESAMKVMQLRAEIKHLRGDLQILTTGIQMILDGSNEDNPVVLAGARMNELMKLREQVKVDKPEKTKRPAKKAMKR